MSKRFSVLLCCLLTLGLFALIAWGNREYLFQLEVHETSDFAVNALQIDRAKSFQELYGNYSRFHFNHPGPAFFYVYALAERVLYDGLGLVPSPHNAHAIGGLLLQCAFFSLALLLLADVLGRRRVVALGLIIGALHFGRAPHTFISIWPPEVLLMPFLAFFAASVSVALGRWQHLPWAVLAGSFLVHGHVAQPLFVAGIFGSAGLVAGVRAYRDRATRAPGLRSHRWALLGSAALLALAFTPLVLDALRGPESNVAHIRRHLQTSEPGKSAVQSALHFLSFVGYHERPEIPLERITGDSFRLISDRPGRFVLWWSALAVVLADYWRHTRRPTAEAAAWRILLPLWCLAVVLCLYWGLKQTGPMFAFNGHFYYALHFLVYLLAATALTQRLPRWAFVLLAVPALGWALLRVPHWIEYEPAYIEPKGLQIREVAQRLLAEDPSTLPRMLVFDREHWSDGASLGLALRRAGVDFRTPPLWTFMFQPRHTLSPEELLQSPFPYPVWRLVKTPHGSSSMALTPTAYLTFAPPRLAPEGGKIHFGRGGASADFHLTGIATPDEARGTWTTDAYAALQFRPEPTEHAVHLRIIAEPFLVPGQGIDLQPTELWFNDHKVFNAPFVGPGVLRTDIPAAVWNEHPVATLRLHFPNANAPADLGLSGDPRPLALLLQELQTERIELEPVAP